MAIFSRKTRGKAQRFDIFEDLIHKGKISLVSMGEKIDTEYRDELSFETAMKKFAEYMNTIGYKKMDDALKVKEFQKEDALLFSDNYLKYANKFFERNNIDVNANSMEFRDCSKKNMKVLFEQDFDAIKDLLMEIAGALVYFMVSNNNAMIDIKNGWLELNVKKQARDGHIFFNNYNVLSLIYMGYQKKTSIVIDKIFE